MDHNKDTPDFNALKRPKSRITKSMTKRSAQDRDMNNLFLIY